MFYSSGRMTGVSFFHHFPDYMNNGGILVAVWASATSLISFELNTELELLSRLL